MLVVNFNQLLFQLLILGGQAVNLSLFLHQANFLLIIVLSQLIYLLLELFALISKLLNFFVLYSALSLFQLMLIELSC